MSLKSFLKDKLVSKELDAQLDKIKKPVGSLGYDPWGFNTDTNKIVLSLFSNIYDKYFRVETSGIEHVPDTGPVLIIGNQYDPMTPLRNALAVKAYLSHVNIKSELVQWNAVSHTALITDSPLSKCVFHAVDHFLINKPMPVVIHCNDWKNPFFNK